MEKWKEINGYEGFYEVSNLGNVRSLDRFIDKCNAKKKVFYKGFDLKPNKTFKGYLVVSLNKNGKRKIKSIHRIVAENFIENIFNKSQVNHKNGVKTDNRVVNLEWSTPSENVKHSFKKGLSKPTWLGVFGKDNPFSKPVNMKDKNGNKIKKFDSLTIASEEMNINIGNIQSVCVGKRKTAGGYIWEYEKQRA